MALRTPTDYLGGMTTEHITRGILQNTEFRQSSSYFKLPCERAKKRGAVSGVLHPKIYISMSSLDLLVYQSPSDELRDVYSTDLLVNGVTSSCSCRCTDNQLDYPRLLAGSWLQAPSLTAFPYQSGGDWRGGIKRCTAEPVSEMSQEFQVEDPGPSSGPVYDPFHKSRA